MKHESFVFVDVETTGLDPERHEIIEFAAISVPKRDLMIPGKGGFVTFEAKVKPLYLERAEPKALEVNGYSDEKWKDATQLDDVLEIVQPLFDDATIAGHNPSFDVGFLNKAWSRHPEFRPTGMDYHVFDTATLAQKYVLTGDIEKPGLFQICEFLGIDTSGCHTAMADAMMSLLAARRLLNAW
jgi:DNA polymerase III epsilon subunit-like protein